MGSNHAETVTTTRRRLLSVPLVGVSGGLSGQFGSTRNTAESGKSTPTYLDRRVPDLLDRYDVPGASIALVEDGEVTWSGAYGTADLAEERPTNENTPFRVQSITKSVTAWGVLKLVDQDEIALDDPIGYHITSWELPDADYSWEEVTIRRVLSHSAGLPAGGYESVPLDEEPPSLRVALSGNADGPAARPTDEPGEFRYSNPGYALLELLIEDVTGRDYAAYMDEEILSLLRMDGATFVMTDRLRSELATEHLVDGTPVPASHGPASAHGELYATAKDIARYVAAGTETTEEPLGRGVLAPETIAELYTETVETTGFYGLATDGAGLGFFVETLADGDQAVMNGGQGAGSWNWFHAVPETGDGIVILTNSERSLQLIADVVETWVEQSGFSAISLTRARRWVRLPVWILVGIAVGLALRLGYGGITGKRSFTPLSKHDRTLRMFLAGLGLATLGLWWTIGRETVAFFLPVIAEWVGLTLSVVVVFLLMTVLFPRTDRGETT
ncbi:serine hydrolase domain-containing protein [Natrarchaeobius oligotrophus]|uniref:Class A beta-lactamase-related serine hydrolase n=1 Tax=Natrarchaeobius chitinivorans TaxID=1679083 RepID=A0A3N6PEC7_NATCH|nr:serine hydrolase domain-containing protein [Natrarchaeobius chitinivorans]RQG95645.1 class A beta-lactamase-related serine hydrolase [Natrarchaeobius chitinivorans]